jgi:hypothetical protein
MGYDVFKFESKHKSKDQNSNATTSDKINVGLGEQACFSKFLLSKPGFED